MRFHLTPVTENRPIRFEAEILTRSSKCSRDKYQKRVIISGIYHIWDREKSLFKLCDFRNWPTTKPSVDWKRNKLHTKYFLSTKKSLHSLPCVSANEIKLNMFASHNIYVIWRSIVLIAACCSCFLYSNIFIFAHRFQKTSWPFSWVKK